MNQRYSSNSRAFAQHMWDPWILGHYIFFSFSTTGCIRTKEKNEGCLVPCKSAPEIFIHTSNYFLHVWYLSVFLIVSLEKQNCFYSHINPCFRVGINLPFCTFPRKISLILIFAYQQQSSMFFCRNVIILFLAVGYFISLQ